MVIGKVYDNHNDGEYNQLYYSNNHKEMMKKILLSMIALFAVGTLVMAQSKETISVNGVSFKMVEVEGGKFKMGATEEQGSAHLDKMKPIHTVVLSDFSIGETEVTQELWKAVMGNNPSLSGGLKSPVNNVSWDDCQAFVQKLSNLTGKRFRLPTESEWEYAARGGKKAKPTKYAGSNTLTEVGICFNNSNSCANDVATKLPNELGIYDMSGNVYEWCYDIAGPYQPDVAGAYTIQYATNPIGASSGQLRVLRGGSFLSKNDYEYRVGDRYMGLTSTKEKYIGLRLVISDFAPPTEAQNITGIEYLYENPTESQLNEWKKKYHYVCSSVDTKNFNVPKAMMRDNPCLVYLLLNSEAMKSGNEQQRWFNLYSLMDGEQINKLYRILYTEQYKMLQIKKKYQ